MCKYCESKKSYYKSTERTNNYSIANQLSISNQKLIVQTNVNRRTNADDYYESWGLDSDGENVSKQITFDIKFCPFCGKKLKSVYNQRIFVFDNDCNKANNFCKQHSWLIEEFDYLRKSRYDSSSNSYYLGNKIYDIISNFIAKANGIDLVNGMYLYNEKPSKYDFLEVKNCLSDGYDVFVEMNSDYRFKDYTIEKLKKFGYDVVVFSVDNLKENSGEISVEF